MLRGRRLDGAAIYAVKGHPFGLNLSAKDREALIAFLKAPVEEEFERRLPR